MIALRLNAEDEQLIKEYARAKNKSVSDVLRTAVLESIEDEIDLEMATKALSDLNKDTKTYTHEEAGKILGLK